MVLALLAGRKTQTRRTAGLGRFGAGRPRRYADERGRWGVTFDIPGDVGLHFVPCPYGILGDRLWGRETFCAGKAVGGYAPVDPDKDPNGPTVDVIYRADDPKAKAVWTPSIFMRRQFSRLLHEVTAVRVERLQDITEEDALAEGIEMFTDFPNTPEYRWPSGDEVFPTAREAYLAGWDTINGEGSAQKNPWVWVVGLKDVRQVRSSG